MPTKDLRMMLLCFETGAKVDDADHIAVKEFGGPLEKILVHIYLRPGPKEIDCQSVARDMGAGNWGIDTSLTRQSLANAIENLLLLSNFPQRRKVLVLVPWERSVKGCRLWQRLSKKEGESAVERESCQG